MFYLVQKNIWGERHYDMMIESLERLGMDYEICNFVPFENEIRDYTTGRKDVWCFGAVQMAQAANKYGFNPGSMYNTNHDFEIYNPIYGNHMLNHEGLVTEFGAPLPEDDKWTMFFARPTKDTKSFTGQVFMRYSWDQYVEDVRAGNVMAKIPDDTKVLISPLKEIHQEIRCWVVGGKVITISQYKIGRRVHYQNLDHDEEAFKFAQDMVDIYQPARSFVIDICRVEEGFKIVEINCINCAGFYDANFQKLIMALEYEFNPAEKI